MSAPQDKAQFIISDNITTREPCPEEHLYDEHLDTMILKSLLYISFCSLNALLQIYVGPLSTASLSQSAVVQGFIYMDIRREKKWSSKRVAVVFQAGLLLGNCSCIALRCFPCIWVSTPNVCHAFRHSKVSKRGWPTFHRRTSTTCSATTGTRVRSAEHQRGLIVSCGATVLHLVAPATGPRSSSTLALSCACRITGEWRLDRMVDLRWYSGKPHLTALFESDKKWP